MNLSLIPQPGRKFGPCLEPCIHRDCRQNRNIAESVCPLCGGGIGFEEEFFVEGWGVGYVHRRCAEGAKAFKPGRTGSCAR